MTRPRWTRRVLFTVAMPVHSNQTFHGTLCFAIVCQLFFFFSKNLPLHTDMSKWQHSPHPHPFAPHQTKPIAGCWSKFREKKEKQFKLISGFVFSKFDRCRRCFPTCSPSTTTTPPPPSYRLNQSFYF